MTKCIVVLRPEPGNMRTATALRALGLEARQVPLFAVKPVAWSAPDTVAYDAILLTSANAVRHGGAGLEALMHLPVVAVGRATAAAATETGFAVAVTGAADARAAVGAARDRGFTRLLHLAGRDRASTNAGIEDDLGGGIDGHVDAITVYASDAVPLDADVARSFEDDLVLLHSTRAAARLAHLVKAAGADRSRIAIVAISQAVGDAAGAGWADVSIAPEPTDFALVACAAAR